MIAREHENEAEVRREDQDRINRFARLNARLNENRAERDEVKVSE
jgi:prefoldin subunit 4